MLLGIWEIYKSEKEGFDLLAPTTYWNASEEVILHKTEGCGPDKIGDWFIPDTIYGESIYLACQIHDWMYSEGKSKEDKKWADILFLVNMILLIVREDSLIDRLRLIRLMTYFQAVYYFGNTAFSNNSTPKLEEINYEEEGNEES